MHSSNGKYKEVVALKTFVSSIASIESYAVEMDDSFKYSGNFLSKIDLKRTVETEKAVTIDGIGFHSNIPL